MIYETVLFIGSVIAKIIAVFDKKTARFFLLRKGEIERVDEYFSSEKSKKNKIIWFHASSAGEFEQAKPLIEHFKSSLKTSRIIASFFSPSGYEAGMKYDKIDFCFNLPLDLRKNAGKLLDIISPHIIIYSKYDVWTNLTIEAHRRGVRLALISATLPEKSLRHRFPFRIFFSKAYSALDRIYAISGKDAERFKKISNSKDNIIVSGDTRFDRVKTVIDNADSRKRKILNKKKNCTYLLAGSTYEASEKKLIPVIKDLNSKGTRIKLILVPHEIDSNNIRRLKKLVSSWGFAPVCYSAACHPVQLAANEILIVDAFGVLAMLYHEADIVFIGGSYKGSVHSVLEPAIFGKPIIAGPHVGNSYEALALNKIGGLSLCEGKDDLYEEILRLARDDSYRSNISKKVMTFFNDNIGAAEFILKDIKAVL